MIKINRHHFLCRLLLATALLFGLLAAGPMSAHAGTVTVTGANGANGHGYYLAGAGQSATATTTTPSDPSNTATATGGNGGSVPFCSTPSECVGGSGGNGGAANSTATTWIGSGARSAEATSFGGSGGNGKGWGIPGPGGNGGAASSSAAASSTTGSASATANSTGGHGGRFYRGNGGAASSSAAASSTTGSASAAASSTGGAGIGAPGGAATASANARNADGAALTSASAPAGSSAKALTDAIVGSGSPPSAPIAAGQAVSNAILTPKSSPIVVGAMSAGYGGTGQALQYTTTAAFDFTTSESLDLDLLSYNTSGIGFDSLELQVIVAGITRTYNFSSLTGSSGAEPFFTANSISLGATQTVSLIYDLNYGAGTPTTTVDGFGFTYQFVDPPTTAVPEPSTWAMMTLGFAGLAFASYCASRKGARTSLSTPSILGGVFSFPPAVS